MPNFIEVQLEKTCDVELPENMKGAYSDPLGLLLFASMVVVAKNCLPLVMHFTDALSKRAKDKERSTTKRKSSCTRNTRKVHSDSSAAEGQESMTMLENPMLKRSKQTRQTKCEKEDEKNEAIHTFTSDLEMGIAEKTNELYEATSKCDTELGSDGEELEEDEEEEAEEEEA